MIKVTKDTFAVDVFKFERFFLLFPRIKMATNTTIDL